MEMTFIWEQFYATILSFKLDGDYSIIVKYHLEDNRAMVRLVE